MFPYDPMILAAASRVPGSVPDVLAIMQTIDSVCVDGDGLKWFNWLYFQVTQAVADRISAGGFTNPAWLAELDVQFAKLYFGALQTTLQNGTAASCWKALFSCRQQIRLTRLQCALAGINAHINHDLPIALVNTFQASGLAPDRSSSQYADYTNLNTTLDSLVDTAKHELNVRLLGNVLPPASKLENTVAAFGVVAARSAAWQNCELLWHLRPSAKLSNGFLNSLDGLTTLASKTLLVEV